MPDLSLCEGLGRGRVHFPKSLGKETRKKKWLVLRTPKLYGGWLGSGTDEGSGKLLYAAGRSMHPLNRRFPNGTSCFGDP